MKKQTIIKIISRMIVSVFLVSIFIPISSINAVSQSSLSNSYSNPNQSANNNPYKFKVSDVVNSQMLTSVVGCTGVVNTVSKWMAGLLQSPAQKAKLAKDKIKKTKEQFKATCGAIKAAGEGGLGAVIGVNDLVTALGTTMETMGKWMFKAGGEEACIKSVESLSTPTVDALNIMNEEAAAKTFKEQCFDGIAITLAKNQLTAMARSTMNWVTSGYGGNPFFVQNMRNLTYNIEKNVIETGIDVLLAPKNASPYASDFARAQLNSLGIVNSSSKFLGGLQSDLSNFISDPTSYYSDAQLTEAEKTQQSLQNARNANNAFARDFSLGGWNGWLALTQREKNNPLGYNMLASQYLSDMQTQAVSDQKAEITQNGGFMSQKECVQWQIFNADGTIKDANKGGSSVVIPTLQPNKPTYTQPDKLNPHEYGECFQFKTITPGSLIKDKVGNYLNSPDRQLELVKTINDGLNVLFSALISKLQGSGLTSLSDSSANITNWTDNMNDLSSDSNKSNYDNNGAYDNFNLTRDLGNTYLHEPAVSYGTWNADTNWTTAENELNNNKKLYPSLNPEIYDATTGTPILTNNAFYTVDTAGKTKLINDGYNSWEKGDRAFWNGTEWQNWKCASTELNGECTNQKSPIIKRGVIQTQEDYIVAVKEILQVLPNIPTKLGELDYCLPGPNPSYKTNSTDAQSAYQNWINTIYTGPEDYTNTDKSVWAIARYKSNQFKNLSSIFDSEQNVWDAIKNSNSVGFFLNYFGNMTVDEDDKDTTLKYRHYTHDGIGSDQFNIATIIGDFSKNYVNNSLFQNFYNAYDKMTQVLYFKDMTSKYLETEDVSINPTTDKNPGYIPMAETGLDLTKDITYYNDDFAQKMQNYKDEIIQAKINIAKLGPIRDEVSGIIKAAQDRRAVNLDKLMGEPNNIPIQACEDVKDACFKRLAVVRTSDITQQVHDTCFGEYNSCITKKTASGEILSEAKLKEAYNSCLAEENIQVYDADGILAMGSKDAENCFDDIDNDLNGLIDSADPACPQIVSQNFKCVPTNDHDVHAYLASSGNGWAYGKLSSAAYTSTPCESRAQNTCSATQYKYAGPSLYLSVFNGNYNIYKVQTCLWVNAKPVKGQCANVPSSSSEVHSYLSDFKKDDNKYMGKLEAAGYNTTICSRRGPDDCSTTQVITSGPRKSSVNPFKPSTWDVYNAYTVNKCEWKN